MIECIHECVYIHTHNAGFQYACMYMYDIQCISNTYTCIQQQDLDYVVLMTIYCYIQCNMYMYMYVYACVCLLINVSTTVPDWTSCVLTCTLVGNLVCFHCADLILASRTHHDTTTHPQKILTSDVIPIMHCMCFRLPMS